MRELPASLRATTRHIKFIKLASRGEEGGKGQGIVVLLVDTLSLGFFFLLLIFYRRSCLVIMINQSNLVELDLDRYDVLGRVLLLLNQTLAFSAPFELAAKIVAVQSEGLPA